MSEHLSGATSAPDVTPVFQNPDLYLPSGHSYILQAAWARNKVDNPFTVAVCHGFQCPCKAIFELNFFLT